MGRNLRSTLSVRTRVKLEFVILTVAWLLFALAVVLALMAVWVYEKGTTLTPKLAVSAIITLVVSAVLAATYSEMS